MAWHSQTTCGIKGRKVACEIRRRRRLFQYRSYPFGRHMTEIKMAEATTRSVDSATYSIYQYEKLNNENNTPILNGVDKLIDPSFCTSFAINSLYLVR